MKTKKIIIMILIFLMLGGKVYAGTKDATLIRNKIDGIYAVAPLSDKIHLYNFEMYTLNGKTTYCIEIGKKITTDTYNSTTNTNEQKTITNLNDDNLNYIKAIAYFGYGYPSHNDNKYYMAAQELIWEYLNNIDITWTSELDVNGPKINIDTYKNEILSLVKRYITPLSIPKSIVYYIDSKNIITDVNNSLSFYDAKSTKIQQISINENKLEINVGTSFIGNDSIILTRKNNYSYPATIYNFEDSQIMLSTGNLEQLKYEINLKIKGVTLTMYVVDANTNKYVPTGQASLLNPKYELYDKNNKLLYEITIPYPGFQKINNLPYGEYYIKHKKASEGYTLNNNITKININKIDNNVTLSEEVIKTTIEINKLYEFENENKREPNITFEIYDNNNQLYRTITTTENGPDIVSLPYGNYTIKQKNTTYGYEKIEDIQINIDERTNTILKYNLLDKKIRTLVHITTKDKTTQENILESDIKYKILNQDTNEYITYINEKNEEIAEYITNEKGELTLPIKLPYGNYVLDQTTSPKEYLKNNEKISFSINNKTEYNYIEDQVMLNIDYYNEPIIGKLSINTTKEIATIKNNRFEKEIKANSNREVELYLNEKLINTYKTDKTGNVIIENLELGTYCVIDKETREKKCVDIKNKDNQTKIIEKTIELVQKQTTTVTITNLDDYNNPINNTIIELIQNKKTILEETTNQNGKIIITNIPLGKYCLKEKRINKKYYINEEITCFDINNINENKNIKIINKIKTKQIKVPNTLNNKGYQQIIILPLLIFILTIVLSSIKKV